MEIGLDGRLVFWTLSNGFDRDVIATTMEQLNWKAHTPRRRSKLSALHAALGQYIKHVQLDKVQIRPLQDAAQNGYAVIEEDPDQQDIAHETLFTAKCSTDETDTQDGIVVVDNRKISPNTVRLNSMFTEQLKILPSSTIAGMLRVIVTDLLKGVSLRPTGGFYWLPASELHAFASVSDMIKAASVGNVSKVYTPEFNLSDTSSVEAVVDAFTADVKSRCEQIEQDAKQDNAGARAIKNRQKQANQLHERIKLYEECLGQSLASLHGKADECESQVVQAGLEAFPDIFGVEAPVPAPAGVSAPPADMLAVG